MFHVWDSNSPHIENQHSKAYLALLWWGNHMLVCSNSHCRKCQQTSNRPQWKHCESSRKQLVKAHTGCFWLAQRMKHFHFLNAKCLAVVALLLVYFCFFFRSKIGSYFQNSPISWWLGMFALHMYGGCILRIYSVHFEEFISSVLKTCQIGL